jgi:hypothetical protein
MTVEKLDSLEDRIQKPGYLLLLVVVLILLIIGLVNLIDQPSNVPVIFGRFSVKYFALIVVYSLITIGWASLLLRPNDDRWLTKLLDFIQSRTILALAALAAITWMLVLMIVPHSFVHDRVLTYPALQVTILSILLIAAGLIIFYKWGDESRPQTWRKVVVALIGLIIILELLIQLLAYFGLAPGVTNSSDAFAPYDRVYQTEEGFGNAMANSYGQYTKEFQLLPDSERIAIIGAGNVQGLQIDKEEDLGVLLQTHFAESGANSPEVLTLGYPEFGPGIYLSRWLNRVVMDVFAPQEVIVFFDVGRDFQTVPGPGYGYPYWGFNEEGEIELIEKDVYSWYYDLHLNEHMAFMGIEGPQIVRFIGSHYLTPQVLKTFVAGESPDFTNNDFVFDDQANDEVVAIASAFITNGQEQFAERGATMKLVTIPEFTEDFYNQNDWNTAFGSSDLMLPEEELREMAQDNEIPFLGLGAYMASQEMSPTEVQALYFQDGRGHLTEAGHELAAEAAYQCFFAQTLTADEGCYLP